MASQQFGIRLENQIVSPLVSAEQALTGVWVPARNRFAPDRPFSDVQVERRDQVSGTQWGTAGVFTIRLARAGAPWRGVVAIANSLNPLDAHWRCYSSSILMPQDGDPRVWQALRAGWDSFRPTPRETTPGELQMRQIRSTSDAAWSAGMADINLMRRQAAGMAPKPEKKKKESG
jgi:hypothetical protein